MSFDFASSTTPGWHTTIFPPYFIVGFITNAIFSGFAMSLTLMIFARKVLRLEEYVSIQRIELINKIIIITGTILGITYILEFFPKWYDGVQYESYAFESAFGPYWWVCYVILPQLLWVKKIRSSVIATFIISIFVNIDRWYYLAHTLLTINN